MFQRLWTPTTGTVVGALLILAGGIIEVSGSSSEGTLIAAAGFVLVLKYRVMPAMRERRK